MGDGHLEAAEGLSEGDGLVDEQVGALVLERGVLLLLHDEDDVARDGAGSLVGLTLEDDLLIVHHALLDVHLQDLFLLHHLLAVALPALVLLADDLSGAAALVAHRLHLLNHARGDLPDHNANAAALAGAAMTRRAALATLAVALGAQHVLRQAQLLGHAVVQILQRHLQAVHDVLALPLALAAGAAAAAGAEGVTAEHGLENVEGAAAAAAAHAALLQALLAVLVVDLPLLGIAEHLVRRGDLLELLRVASLVGVVLDGRLAVRLLDLVGIRVLGHAEEVVKLLGVALRAPGHAAEMHRDDCFLVGLSATLESGEFTTKLA
mmetsp:Transcript_3613/g.15856  ORF Transcript_3613/g.15856 Transcript_3613/m.15856 type:complete len:322 (+) Transcript_3613:2748-3713(+)